MHVKLENKYEVLPLRRNVVVRLIHEDVKQHKEELLGLTADSELMKKGFELPETMMEKQSVPIQKGEVLDMCPNAFGEAYDEAYGIEDKLNRPQVGDLVMFTRYQNYNLDKKQEYAIIPDERIHVVLREVK